MDVPSNELLEKLKSDLLCAVAGLDRGVAARSEDISRVEATCSALESSAPALSEPQLADLLNGKWRLLYTSAFAGPVSVEGVIRGGSVGRLPGPVSVQQVYQQIDSSKPQLDNIVQAAISVFPFPPAEATIYLEHALEIIPPRTVKVTQTGAKVELPEPLPQLEAPQTVAAPGPSNLRSTTFEVTYVDSKVRITRGDRGELRIYCK
eukprot:CAMPEP_0197845822 /NCGR_PEP_ID=MMETSP1438-20131217/2692_1 /TAXON_ID=1461541 /ORGANISM="Pterosperma sp., Strain CCMP1384" /LENGTH=205 /DNA_ID=CAMNT_0043457261 /DNA_START=335 /DNA_END=952 /DNA_ORIENTATION=-